MTKEQLKAMVPTKEQREDGVGYSKQLKEEVCKHINSGESNTIAELERYLGVPRNSILVWFKQLGIDRKFKTHRVRNGKSGVRYTIPTKIRLAELVLHDGLSISEVCTKMDISRMTASKWIQDYQDGLYTLDNVVQVTRKKIISSEVLLTQYKDLETRLEEKKKELKTALEHEYKVKLKEIGIAV